MNKIWYMNRIDIKINLELGVPGFLVVISWAITRMEMEFPLTKMRSYFKYNLFLEQFYVHSKAERKEQIILICPVPHL